MALAFEGCVEIIMPKVIFENEKGEISDSFLIIVLYLVCFWLEITAG